MTIDELADFLHHHSSCAFCIYGDTECNEAKGCIEGIKEWLKGVEDDGI